MRAKKINEDIKDILKPKDEEEIKKLIKPGAIVPAQFLADLINKSEIGQSIKVNFTGAWDLFGPIQKVWIADINQGRGFEKALFVIGDDGTFIYLPTFKLDNLPDNNSMLLFYAENAIYINKIIS